MIAANERIPGTPQTHHLVKDPGLAAGPRRVLLIGMRASSADSELDLRATQVRTRHDTRSRYGPGSGLDLMMRAALGSVHLARHDAEPGTAPEIFCMAVPPPSGQGMIRAVFTITAQGPATASGTTRPSTC